MGGKAVTRSNRLNDAGAPEAAITQPSQRYPHLPRRINAQPKPFTALRLRFFVQAQASGSGMVAPAEETAAADSVHDSPASPNCEVPSLPFVLPTLPGFRFPIFLLGFLELILRELFFIPDFASRLRDVDSRAWPGTIHVVIVEHEKCFA